MIIAKLVLFASPVFVTSMLFLANPAAALSIDSASGRTHIDVASTKAVHHLAAFDRVNDSNPILEQLGCNCAYCTQAQLQLEGKLSISDIL